MRPSRPAPAVELTAHTRYRSKNEAVARSSSVLLRISAPPMQMFHAYFTRAYRYAPPTLQAPRVCWRKRTDTPRARSSEGSFHAHASPLFGVWATSPTCETESTRVVSGVEDCEKFGGWAGLQVRVPTRIRIGNEHADRFLTYPRVHACACGPGQGQ